MTISSEIKKSLMFTYQNWNWHTFCWLYLLSLQPRNDYLWPTFVLPSTSNVKGFTNITIWFLNLGKESAEFENTAIQAAGAVISVLIPLTIYAIFSKKINRFN